MMKWFFQFAVLVLLPISLSHSETREIRIGVIASLTGFAAQYGQAVVAGIKAAQPDRDGKVKIRLYVEDDQSQVSKALSAYQKLRNIDRIDALIGGSWWINGIVKIVEKDGIPFLSCETLYNKDFVQASNYFSLGGDLRHWVRAFRPLVEFKQWRSAMMIRFVSGFSDTLEAEFEELFKPPQRKLFPSLVYSDVGMTGSATLALKALQMKPDVLFVDSQPESFANFVRELQKLKETSVVVLSHSVAEDAIRQKLFQTEGLSNRLYFLRRSSYSAHFERVFEERFGAKPTLNADLGYYAVKLIVSSFETGDNPVASLKSGLVVDGLRFEFDEHNVFSTVVQEVYGIDRGKISKIEVGARTGEQSDS